MTPTLKAARERVEQQMLSGGRLPGMSAVATADLRTILAALDEQDWRPIETAPRDGTAVLLWYKQKSHVAAYWVSSPWNGMWVSGTVGFLDCDNFTHWRPLPAPPVEVKG